MRVLLTRPATWSSLPWYFPSGIGYIARALLDKGHHVRFSDPEVEQWDLAQHCNYLAHEDYDVLGISALINKYNYVRKLVQASKEAHPHARIVLGGNITGPIWELLLQKMCVDVLVIGEGEKTIQEVLEAFEGNIAFEAVQGIAFRRKGKPFLTPYRTPIANLDDIPFPAYEIFPMETYLTTPGKLARRNLASRDLSMITSRGCPFHCTFCYRPSWEKVRYRSHENVISEIHHLIDNYCLDGITFNDELTIVSKRRAYEFCEVMETINISWGCVGRVNTVDEKLLKRMYDVGCRWITYGIESGSETILSEMKKDVSVSRAKNAVIWTQNAGISTNPTFMFGYPSESRATAMETLKFIRETNLHPDSFFFATPYPGTVLFEQAIKMDRISSVEEYLLHIDGKDAHTFLVNLTQMSDRELIKLKDQILMKVAPPGSKPMLSSSWGLCRWRLQHYPLVMLVGRAICIVRDESWKVFFSKALSKFNNFFYALSRALRRESDHDD